MNLVYTLFAACCITTSTAESFRGNGRGVGDGITTVERRMGLEDIIGGEESPPGKFPYYARYTGEYSCGTTLIHDDIVIGAAHCRVPQTCTVIFNTTVRVGSDEGTPATIEQYVVRDDFRLWDFENDFMIMKLSDIPDDIAPIGFNTDDSVPADGEVLTAMGFGRTANGGPFSDVLLETTLDYLSFEECAPIWEDPKFSGLTDDVQFCADGGEERDTCNGDSGGPLITEDNEGVVVGIVSFGQLCASEIPGIYTRVSGFTSWINDAICCLSDFPPSSCDSNDCPDSFGIVVECGDVRDNEDCVDATSLSLGVEEIGSTIGVSTESLEFCGVESDSIGVWYSITGNGLMMKASTCSFYTTFTARIAVFGGSCGDLTCIEESEMVALLDERCQEVVWDTEDGVQYFIHVHSKTGNSGDFSIRVDSASLDCNDAVELQPGMTISGFAARGFYDPSVPFCGDNVDTFQPSGAWYSITGDGGRMEATTCGESNFDTQITILEGSCGNFRCITGNDDDLSCPHDGHVFGIYLSTASWDTEIGIQYFIFVHFVADVGYFELTVSSDSGDPPTPPPTRPPTSVPPPTGTPPTRPPTSVPPPTATQDPTFYAPYTDIMMDMLQMMIDMVTLLPGMTVFMQRTSFLGRWFQWS